MMDLFEVGVQVDDVKAMVTFTVTNEGVLIHSENLDAVVIVCKFIEWKVAESLKKKEADDEQKFRDDIARVRDQLDKIIGRGDAY